MAILKSGIAILLGKLCDENYLAEITTLDQRDWDYGLRPERSKWSFQPNEILFFLLQDENENEYAREVTTLHWNYLVSSFCQVPLHPMSVKYTTFLHQEKYYEFCVIPFSLKTSIVALFKFLELVLRGLEVFVIPLIDDILSISQNTSQHLDHFEFFSNAYRMTT